MSIVYCNGTLHFFMSHFTNVASRLHAELTWDVPFVWLVQLISFLNRTPQSFSRHFLQAHTVAHQETNCSVFKCQLLLEICAFSLEELVLGALTSRSGSLSPGDCSRQPQCLWLIVAYFALRML